MALPNLSTADLEKLKFFINFVSENPTVLNLPQLKFVKDFVEKLGGKVPEGEFKMPAGGFGGKCPFGGSASGASDATSGMNIDDSEESELDESEPESEVELDMEANTLFSRNKVEKRSAWSQSTTVQDTSTVYLEESKVARKEKRIKTESEQGQDDGDEYECHVEAVYGTEAEDSMYEEDPIKTNIASVEMKSEVESDFENDDVFDENYKNEGDEEEEEDEDEGSDSDESDYRKPLLRIKTRSSKRAKHLNKDRTARNTFKCLKYEKKIRKPKPVRCAGKCRKQCERINEDQRKKLCQEFWALNYVERKNYLLSCIERKPLGKLRAIKRKKEERKHTNHYFMATSDGGRARVCLSFFLKTLSTSNYLVKDALQNSDGNGKYTGIDLRGGSGEGRRCKLKLLLKNQAKLSDEGTMVKDSENGSKKIDSLTENAKVSEETKHFEPNQAEANEQNEITRTQENATTEDNQNIIKSSISSGINDHPTSLPTEKPNEVCMTIVPSKDSAEVTITTSQPEKRKKPVDRRKRISKERAPQPVNCEQSCRFKCHTKFTEEQRVLLCAAFWRLSYKRRKDFVLSRVEVHENTYTTAAEYRKTDRVRTFTNRYFLRGERGENVRVCSRFFNATLCVGSHYLANAQKHVDKQTGAYAGEDGRGKSTKWNRTPDTLISGVHEHINSYPTWVPHKNYKTRFLHSSLNIKKMYNEYKEECQRQKKKMVSCSFFRKIFHKDFRLAFLQPKSKHGHKVSSHRKCVTIEEAKTTVADAATTSSNNIIQASSVLLKSSNDNSSSTAVTTGNTSWSAASVTNKKKGVNPNISVFTGEEGGFWSQLSPNATETMRFLQQRYAPQSSLSSSTPVIITPTYQHQHQQQQRHQQSQQLQRPLQEQQQQQHPSDTLTQQQQLLPHQQQLLVQPAHLVQPTAPQIHSTSIYQLPPQVVGYMHQTHIMNAGGGYESEERIQNFHML